MLNDQPILKPKTGTWSCEMIAMRIDDRLRLGDGTCQLSETSHPLHKNQDQQNSAPQAFMQWCPSKGWLILECARPTYNVMLLQSLLVFSPRGGLDYFPTAHVERPIFMVPPSSLVLSQGWGLIDLLLRASDENILIVRVPRAQKINSLHPLLFSVIVSPCPPVPITAFPSFLAAASGACAGLPSIPSGVSYARVGVCSAQPGKPCSPRRRLYVPL
jgi:hypothetical protein